MNVRRYLLGAGALTLGLIVLPASAEAQQQQQMQGVLNNPAMVAQICAAFANMATPGGKATPGQPVQIQLQMSGPAPKNAKPAADTTSSKPADAATPHAEHSKDSASAPVAVKDSAAKAPAAAGTAIECPAPAKKTP